MKSFLIGIYFTLCISVIASAQENTAVIRNRNFQGAEAKLGRYRAIYQLDCKVSNIIDKTIRNINHTLADPRLKGKTIIELVIFSEATDILLKTSKYKMIFEDLLKKGVIIAQCTSSLNERNLTKEDLYEFVAYVPTAPGELIIRATQGWVIIKL